MNKKYLVLLISIAFLIYILAVSFIKNDNTGRYRWAVKTITDEAGKDLPALLPEKASIKQIANEVRTVPDYAENNSIRYDNEKRKVEIEATLKEIRSAGDGDFHMVLESEGYDIVSEVPDGDGQCFKKNKELKLLFNNLRMQIIKQIGFTPNRTLKPVNRKVIVEGIPFWDKYRAEEQNQGRAKNGREIHPITKITFL